MIQLSSVSSSLCLHSFHSAGGRGELADLRWIKNILEDRKARGSDVYNIKGNYNLWVRPVVGALTSIITHISNAKMGSNTSFQSWESIDNAAI